MRPFGLPPAPPLALIPRVFADLGAIARAARGAPAQLEPMLDLGEAIVATGRGILEIGERLDARMQRVIELGEQIEERAAELLEMGTRIQGLGEQVDTRGAEIVARANDVVERGGELISVLPALERALEMAQPLEGAIDRFGRLVDRLPGGPSRRRPGSY